MSYLKCAALTLVASHVEEMAIRGDRIHPKQACRIILVTSKHQMDVFHEMSVSKLELDCTYFSCHVVWLICFVGLLEMSCKVVMTSKAYWDLCYGCHLRIVPASFHFADAKPARGRRKKRRIHILRGFMYVARGLTGSTGSTGLASLKGE